MVPGDPTWWAPDARQVADLAAHRPDTGDARALSALARAWAEVDPVPPDLVQRVVFAAAFDELMAEVASIQRLAAPVGAEVRGADTATSISFQVAAMTVMVAITHLGCGRRRVDGWISPSGSHVVQLRQEDEITHSHAGHGRFVFPSVTDGMVQLAVSDATTNQVAMVTPVFQL